MSTMTIDDLPVRTAANDPLAGWMRDHFERSPDLMCVHDLEGRILAANPTACQALGYSATELEQMNIQDLLADDARFLFQPYLDTLFAAGEVMGRMSVTTRNGERRTWAYRNALTGGPSPVITGMARDVTVRDTAFRAIVESESHFRTLVEHGADLIGIINVDRSIRYVSPSIANTLQYDPQECLGKPLETFVHDDERAMLEEACARAAHPDATTERIELRMRTMSGSFRSFEVMFNGLVHGRETTGLVLNARDITDRKLLEQQLEQATRLTSLGRLAATVAHEFNNVLMGMMPFVEILGRSMPSQELLGHITRHLQNSVHRGKTVTRDMLRFTRPADPQIEPLSLEGWWQRFASEAQVLIGDGIRLTSAVEPLTIMADGNQLSQIFSNLVTNARDAMPEGGELSVRARVPGASETFSFGLVPDPSRFVQISIEDSGSGIPPDLMRHVFEPLFTTKTHGGTGLGLAVAHQVVTRHGGFIFAESSVGYGTTFHLFLPRVEDAPPAERVVGGSPVLATRRLLVVEDEATIAEGLVALLEDDFQITVASSGEEALAIAGGCDPDVVVLDIGLPDMDGTDVALLLRERHPSMPVIFATGHGDVRHISIGPLVRLLRKPFEITELLDAIADLEREAAS